MPYKKTKTTPPRSFGGHQVPPQNIEAEESLISAIMLDNSTLFEVLEVLKPEDFYSPSHQKIFSAITDLFSRSEPIDLITLTNILSEKGDIEDIGGSSYRGATYLSWLADAAPVAVNAVHYSRIIRDKASLRRLIEKAGEITRRCFEEQGDVDEVINFAESAVFEISENKIKQSFYSLNQLIDSNMHTLEERQGNKSLVTGVPTGFTQLDRLTAGLQPSDLIILAARPSMGKTAFALNLARNAAVDGNVPVGVFSLEMSKEQLSMRLLCAEARVDSSRVRSGYFTREDWDALTEAASILSEAPVYIDDSADLSAIEVRAKCRRLKMEKGLGLVVIDYMQLMRGRSSNERRELEISEISRSLKGLAKELSIPVIALSQLNRKLEERGDKRPMLSDLRESGCLTGDTMIYLPDRGDYQPIRNLVGQAGFNVSSLDPETWKLKKCLVSKAFCTGTKPVYRLTTQLGRTICATANHRFLGFQGWKRLDELQQGEHIALPRILPDTTDQSMTDKELALLGHLIGDGCTLPRHAIQYTTKEEDLAHIVADLACECFGKAVKPVIKKERNWYQVYLSATEHLTCNRRNPVSTWLDRLNIFGLRSYQKYVPAEVFRQSGQGIAIFLRHLWTTDGCIHLGRNSKKNYPAIYYASSSEQLARDVQSLLLRLGINARLTRRSQNGKGRDQFHVTIGGKPDIEQFIETVGTAGQYKTDHLTAIQRHLLHRPANTNRDIIPHDIWRTCIVPALQSQGMTTRQFQAQLGNAYCGTTLYKHGVSRERAARIADIVQSGEIMCLATSEVYWDRIALIEPAGEEEVFDLTVPEYQNFVANDIIVHNSIEQDADVVAFIYRDEVYNKDENNPNRGKAEIILGKQRNGPIGTAHLVFLNTYTRFENPAPGDMMTDDSFS